MRTAVTRLALLLSTLSVPSMLLLGACAGGQRLPPIDPSVPQSPYAKPQPADLGPGCYDLRGRPERTIVTAAECAIQGWVWRP